MKSIVLGIACMASWAAADGSVEFCVNDWNVNPGYECATYTFGDDGNCWNLPQLAGTFQQPNLRGRTRFVSTSKGFRCDLYSQTGCVDLIGGLDGTERFDRAISSVKCQDDKK